MIAKLLDIFVGQRSTRIVRANLTKKKIKETFDDVRGDLEARTLHRQERVHDQPSGVKWSLWIGRFEKPVPWLLTKRFLELRYGCLLLLEKAGYVGVMGHNVGDAAERVLEQKVSYQKLLALHSASTTEVESLSTRTLRAARVGVARSSQTGRHLEQSLSRVGAIQSAASQVSLRRSDEAWKVTPGSGRVALSGPRVVIPELCAWFAATCKEIEDATEPSDFIKAFAHPVDLADLPADVTPVALQLDASIVDDLLEGGATLTRNDVALAHTDDVLQRSIRELWTVELPRTAGDAAEDRWRLKEGATDVGYLTTVRTKISLRSAVLQDVQVAYEDGTKETLNQVFNGPDQPFRLTFSDPSFGYAAGQLFRDHRLLGSREALLGLLSPQLDASTRTEKGIDNGQFASDSLFGFVVAKASSDDDFLVCDDMATEWADFIGVASGKQRISFYHCKSGKTDVGASCLQELVSQATKNLGYLTATSQELLARRAKWEGPWSKTAVSRLQRGAAVDDFIGAFSKSVVAPQATRSVVLVTSALSRVSVQTAFAQMDSGLAQPEAFHVLWLLLGFVDQCRAVGAIPSIVCRA